MTASRGPLFAANSSGMKSRFPFAALATFIVAVAPALVASGGCSSTTATSDAGADTGAAFPSCKAIIDACHPVDTGEGPGRDCHDIGHAGKSEEECAPKKAACVATCLAMVADSGTDAAIDAPKPADASADADSGHAHDHDP